MDAANFNVYLTDDSDPSVMKDLFIISVDDASKSLLVKFPGAVSGNYHL